MNTRKHNTGSQMEHVHWEGKAQLSEKDFNKLYRRRFGFFGKRNATKAIQGWDLEFDVANHAILLHPRPNLVVNVGVARSLDNLFQINGTGPAPSPALGAVLRIGVDNGTTNPTATSLSSNNGGGTDTGSTGTPGQTLRTFNSAATRTGLTTSASGTFNDTTTGGIGAVGFIMKRLFLSAHTSNVTNAVASDADNSLYSMTNVFTIDFTGISTWSLIFTSTVSGVGS